MAVFTAPTNLVVWMMAPLQLRNLWLHHLKIHIYLMGAPQFNTSKIFWWNEVNWEDKPMKSQLYQRGYNSQLLFTNTIWFCHFYTNPTKSALMGYFTWSHNLWSDGCLVTTAVCPQGYQRILCLGWPLGIQPNCSYWLFGGHAHLGKFLLNQSNKQRVLMHGHQGWNVRHGLCHIYMIYVYIYELFIAFVCFVVCSLL